MSFFSDFRYLNLMTSSAAILNFRMRHSHGRNFCPILFKFGSDVAMGNPVFAIENQQNRSVTFGFTKNRAYDFSRFSPKNRRQNQNCPIQASEVSFSTNSDMLNTNLIIFFRFEKSLPVQSEKSRKREVISYIKMTEYVDIALSDLVSIIQVACVPESINN